MRVMERTVAYLKDCLAENPCVHNIPVPRPLCLDLIEVIEWQTQRIADLEEAYARKTLDGLL